MLTETEKYGLERSLNIDNRRLTRSELATMKALVPSSLMAQMEADKDENIHVICGAMAAQILGLDNLYSLMQRKRGTIFRVDSSPQPGYYEHWLRRFSTDIMRDVMWGHHHYSDTQSSIKIFEVKHPLYHQFPAIFGLRIAREIEVSTLQAVIYQVNTDYGKQWRKIHFADRQYRQRDVHEKHRRKRSQHFIEDPEHSEAVARKRPKERITRNIPSDLYMLALNTLIENGSYDTLCPEM